MTTQRTSGPEDHRTSRRFGGSECLWWLLACIVGWTIGGQIGATIGSTWHPSNAGALVVAVGVALSATAQWWVLRSTVGRIDGWVPVSLTAVAVVAVLVLMVEPIDGGVGVAIGGAVLGVTQWPVLRPHVRSAAWWIPVSILGWIGGGLLSGAVSPPAGWVVIGAVYGATTGAALVWMLNTQSPPGSPGLPGGAVTG